MQTIRKQIDEGTYVAFCNKCSNLNHDLTIRRTRTVSWTRWKCIITGYQGYQYCRKIQRYQIEHEECNSCKFLTERVIYYNTDGTRTIIKGAFDENLRSLD